MKEKLKIMALPRALTGGEAFKKALSEKIEDEYDIAAFGEAYDEYVASGEKSRPISELWKELNI